MASDSRWSGYVASIDGLRAVAVILVLLYHADYAWFEGGFVGVDVFFVISGFLITRNILHQVENGEWSLLRFYANRIARLFPALATTVSLTLVTAFFILVPEDLTRLAHSGWSALLSISNLFFWSEAGYFDGASEVKPLLHTWSLGVEEQLYLFWPILIVILARHGSSKITLVGVVVACTLSLIGALIYTVPHPEGVFFLTPFRIYEFGFGAIAAHLWHSGAPRIATALIAWAAVGTLIYLSAAIENPHNILVAALGPAALTVGFIIGAEHASIKAIFASRPMRWIGNRSYSIYLVHWPVTVLWRMSADTPLSGAEKPILLILSIMGGALLYSGIERRYRFNKTTSAIKQRTILLGSACALVTTAGIAATYHLTAGVPQRIPIELRTATADLPSAWDQRNAAVRTGICNLSPYIHEPEQYDRQACLRGRQDRPSYLVLGDSYGSEAYWIFKEAFPGVHFGQLTIEGCSLRRPDLFGSGRYAICTQLFAEALHTLIAGREFQGAILASEWTTENHENIAPLLQEIAQIDLSLILVGPRIRFSDHVPNILLRVFNLRQANSEAQRWLVEEPFVLNDRLRSSYGSAIQYVDAVGLQCSGLCQILNDNDELQYLDHSHLSVAGMRVLAAQLRSAYPQLFAAKR